MPKSLVGKQDSVCQIKDSCSALASADTACRASVAALHTALISLVNLSLLLPERVLP